MRTFHLAAIGAALALGLSGAASAQYLMVTGSQTGFRGVALFDPHTGALVNSQYFDISAQTTAIPKHAMQVGNEIWISLQSGTTGNRIDRHTLTGAFLGSINAAGSDGEVIGNVRGMALINNEVWLTNAAGTPGAALVKYDMDGNWLATHPAHSTTSSPFSILQYSLPSAGPHMLVGSSTGDDIQVYGLNGAHIGPFHVGSINFVQQMVARSTGSVLAAGFSTTAGIYEYDASGNQIGFFAAGGARGVWELGNGNIMWTSGSGVHIWDGTSNTTVLSGLSAQYIDFLLIPGPGGLALLGLAGFIGRRRRRG
jgi:hypothetical protein